MKLSSIETSAGSGSSKIGLASNSSSFGALSAVVVIHSVIAGVLFGKKKAILTAGITAATGILFGNRGLVLGSAVTIVVGLTSIVKDFYFGLIRQQPPLHSSRQGSPVPKTESVAAQPRAPAPSSTKPAASMSSSDPLHQAQQTPTMKKSNSSQSMKTSWFAKFFSRNVVPSSNIYRVDGIIYAVPEKIYQKGIEIIDLSNTNADGYIDLSKLDKLLYLNISNSPLIGVNNADNCSVVHLDISRNNYTDISFVKKLAKLEHLNASHNRLRSVDFRENRFLEYIDLRSNNLKDVNLSENRSLYYVNLNHNGLSGRISFKRFSDLMYIDISRNKISNVCLSDGENLEHVDLSSNRIENIEGDFGKNKNLRYLNLSLNETLKEIGDLFECVNLEILNLDCTGLYQLPKRLPKDALIYVRFTKIAESMSENNASSENKKNKIRIIYRLSNEVSGKQKSKSNDGNETKSNTSSRGPSENFRNSESDSQQRSNFIPQDNNFASKVVLKRAFEILDIKDSDISFENFKRAYKKWVIKNHPDKVDAARVEIATQKIKELEQLYSKISKAPKLYFRNIN